MFYKIIDGKKVLVNAKGEVIKNAEGEAVEVSDENLEEYSEDKETEEDDEVVEELKAYFKTLSADIASQAGKKVEEVQGKLSKEFLDELRSLTTPEKKQEGIDAEEIKTLLKEVKLGKKRNVAFNVKTLSELNSLTGDVIQPDRDPAIDEPVKRDPYLFEVARSETTNSDKIEWVEAFNAQGEPADTAELATIPERDWDFKTVREEVRKIAVLGKNSNEILEDAPQLVAFLRDELMSSLKLKTEEKFLKGTGTNEWNGLLNRVPTFSAGSLANTLQNGSANYIDVLRVAISQIRKAGKGSKRFVPNAIFMNPEDTVKLDLAKDSNGAYVLPPFTAPDRTTIKGVRIYETPLIDAGNFLVGDFTKVALVTRRGFTIQASTENSDDFEKDMVTFRITYRGAIKLKTNDNGAFVKGVFATAIADLEADA